MSHRTSARLRAALPVVLLALLALLVGVVADPGRPAAAKPPPDWEPPEPPEPEPDPEPEPEPEPDPQPPPPPPPPDPECDAPGGLPRPTGTIPPGYVYAPTPYNGTVLEIQPDDTFAADAPGHAVHTGKLRTRTANGREELLVCAHVGTNTASNALTAFPLTGPGAHPATIAPRVVVIDAAGGTTHYDLGAPGIQGTLSHYAGATDPHTGYVQMWVPFTPTMREPGFTVRVEVRGTAALPTGGTTQVMGADEVFVHLGRAPVHSSTRVEQALGVALDDAAVAARPTDPGADDLSTILAPTLEAAIAASVEDDYPDPIEDDWVWDPNDLASTTGGGTIHSVDTFVHSLSADLVNFNETEGRVEITFQGTARPEFTTNIRRWGATPPQIVDGSCDVETVVTFQGRAAFTLGFDPTRTLPVVDIGFVDVQGDVGFIDAHGTLTALWLPAPLPIPTDLNCNYIEDKIQDGVVEMLDEKFTELGSGTELERMEAEAAALLSVADLTKAPLRTIDVTIPGGAGFTLSQARYVPTAPPGHVGGDVAITTAGIDLAAGLNVDDQGGTRFPYSYVPSATTSLVNATHDRGRVGTGTSYDVGLTVSGATVNQLVRALTAGKPQPVHTPPGGGTHGWLVGPGDVAPEIGILDILTGVDLDDNGTDDLTVFTYPSVSPLYLPTPPTGWPADGPVDVLVPSLRVSIPVPQIATMAVDVSVGLGAGIDAANHLAPTVVGSDVRPRFLRLGAGLNQVTDPADEPGGIIAFAAAELQEAIPARVAAMLRPIALPDISAELPGGGVAQVHLADLTIGTVGGGHLGAQVEVLPGPPPPPSPSLVTSWVSAPGTGAPASLTAEVAAFAVPGGSGPLVTHWMMIDGYADEGDGNVVYQSPAGGETATAKTVPATGLVPSTDPCTGERTAWVGVTVVLTRGGESTTVSGHAYHVWPGTPPTHPPSWCEPPPEEEPEPEEPPEPPICIRQPWKCPDESTGARVHRF